MKSKKYTVAIDLGESNVVMVVGSLSREGLITINSVVSHPCQGVRCGIIDNIALVEEAIKEVVQKTEEALGIRILEVYAGISGEFVRFACHSDHVYVADLQNGVEQSDVDALFERMKHVQAPDGEVIMERVPQNYVVDDSNEVKNPVGSFGRRLSSTFNFMLCAETPMQRLENVLRRLGITLICSYPNTLAQGYSLLTPDEKEEGVVVVDIGGGLTDLTIYYRNVVRYAVSIPMGATAINQDIRTMMISEKYIEQMKRDYGSAVADLVPEDKAIKVSGRTPRESKNILLYNLAVVIEARLSQLVEFIISEIKDSGYEGRLPYGIVISGGSANLKNIDELFRRLTDMEIRIGVPTESLSEESLEVVASPEFATVVGILLRGMKHGSCTTEQRIDASSSPSPEVKQEQDSAPKSPRVVGKTESYIPPAPRPYVPPKSTAHLAEEEKPKKPLPVKEQESKEQQAPPIYEPSPEPEQSFDDVKSNDKEEAKGKNGRDWASIFKKTFDKINDGFNAADDEEI